MNTPDAIVAATESLFEAGHSSEDAACRSPEFRRLTESCIAYYATIEGSRLPDGDLSANKRMRVGNALRRFFRFVGAPWLGGNQGDAAAVAADLHAAFFRRERSVTFLAPLDNFDPDEYPPPEGGNRTSYTFGPHEVRKLSGDDLKSMIPSTGFADYGDRYAVPCDDLDGFWWVVVKDSADCGPIWQGDPHDLSHIDFSTVGQSRLFDPSFPEPVEDAIFTLLLTLDPKQGNQPWLPFYVPWIYSFSDDPFAMPRRRPSRQELTWQPVGPDDDIFEVPATYCPTEILEAVFAERLEKTWRLLSETTFSRQPGTEVVGFITRHFFVKSFKEDKGIDEIMANLTCLESLFMMKNERRVPMMQRIRKVTGSNRIKRIIDRSYKMRNDYIHALGDLDQAVSWKNCADLRYATHHSIRAFLEYAETQPNVPRNNLLECLVPHKPVSKNQG